MKKQLKESNEDKKLTAANIYLNLYMNTLEEIINDNGRIYLREYGDEYSKVCIIKKESKCWIDYDFWREFSELFSLQYNDIQSIITKWVEDTYQLEGIHSSTRSFHARDVLKIPTN